jgi:hypothetical protein
MRRQPQSDRNSGNQRIDEHKQTPVTNPNANPDWTIPKG